MGNFIFWAIVASCMVGAIATFRVKRSPAPRTSTGPVPGYTRTDGTELDISGDHLLVGDEQLTPASIETFHSEDRSRLIISFRAGSIDGPGVMAQFKNLARHMQERTSAHVVLLTTIDREPQNPEVQVLYCADELGWAGREQVRWLTRGGSSP